MTSTPESAGRPLKRGSLAYRRMVLGQAALETFDAFSEGLERLRPTYGWVLTVDLAVELLEALGRHAPQTSRFRDGFGRLRLEALIPLRQEDDRLRDVVRAAQAPGLASLPAHQSFALALEGQEHVEALLRLLLPTWQQALDGMQAAGWDQGPGIAAMTAFLARAEEREITACHAAFLAHVYLRRLALPPGTAWVATWQPPAKGKSLLAGAPTPSTCDTRYAHTA